MTATATMIHMHTVCLGIGSNRGDRQAHLEAAKARLGKLPQTELVDFSRAFETEPVGPIEQKSYLNAAAVIRTTLLPPTLLGFLHEIEKDRGREVAELRIRWGPRPLDLDILLYDDWVVDEENLTIPHPLMHERAFVLEPLAEIAPRAVHPILNKTVNALFAEIQEGS